MYKQIRTSLEHIERCIAMTFGYSVYLFKLEDLMSRIKWDLLANIGIFFWYELDDLEGLLFLS